MLKARVWRAIETNPQMTKTALARLVSGKRQDVLTAIGLLIDEGYVQTQPGERGPVLTVAKAYPPGEPLGNPSSANGGEPAENCGGLGRPCCDDQTNDREVPQRTDTDKPAGLALVTEPRCRCCRDPGLRDRINRMIAGGFSLRAIYESLAAVNAGLPSKRRISPDSLQTHRSRHFDVQVGASAVWRRIAEARSAADAVNYENGVMSLITPRIYLETVVTKGYAALIDENAEVTLGEGLAASRELAKLVANDDQEQRWAKIHTAQARIVAAFRDLPAPYQQQVLDAVDGRTAPPPGSPRLALVEDTVTDDEEIDPFDVEAADDDD